MRSWEILLSFVLEIIYYYYYYYYYLFIPLSLRTEHRASTGPRHPRILFQFLGSIRHLVGLLGGGISPPQGLYLNRTTQHRKTQKNIHAPSRIRTCNSNIRAVKDSTCLRLLGHWDRQVWYVPDQKCKRYNFPCSFNWAPHHEGVLGGGAELQL
jgi:hypothetical protein